ncbi:MAG TPA: hypothetical protein VGG48_00330 [Rhizomicrobium sp.]|jgi:hypothetical protein
MRTLLMIVGFLAFVAGLIWIGQGLGYITWHPSFMKPSFMVGDMHWTYYGAGLSALGLVIILFARRR